MAVRKFSPVTPGQRHKVIGTFEEITASVPEKSLVYGKRSTGGRNNTGKMILTVQPVSLFSSMQMVRNVTSLLLTASRLATS